MKRLILFLPLFLLATANAQDKEYIAGNFLIAVQTDPIDDSREAYAFAREQEGDDDLTLGMKCMADGLNIIAMHTYMSGDERDRVRVTYRFDKDDPIGPERWNLFSTNTTSWMPLSKNSEFVSRARRADRIVLRVVDPADSETLTSTMSLSGFSAAYDELTPCD